MNSKIFDNFMPSFATDKDFALTITGQLAVKRKDGDYALYDKETGTISNQMDFVLSDTGLEKMIILMPTKATDLKSGDLIKSGNDYYYVTAVDDAGKVDAINVSTGNIGAKAAEKNILTGVKMYKKVISFLDNMMTDPKVGTNPLMMMALLGDKSGEKSDMMEMLILSSMMSGTGIAGMGGINPLMLMAMSGKKDDNKALLMAMMMSGGANPFTNMGGMFGTVDPPNTAEPTK